MSGSALYIITPSLLFKKHETDFHGKRRLKIKKRLDKYSKDCVGRKGSHVGGGMIFFFFFHCAIQCYVGSKCEIHTQSVLTTPERFHFGCSPLIWE